jgi:low affinity Fe/Cu permease
MSSEHNSQNTPSYFTDQQPYTSITIIAITVVFLWRNCYVSTDSVYANLSEITSKFRIVAMFVITGLKIAFHG